MVNHSGPIPEVAQAVRREMAAVDASINGLAEATGIPFSTLRRKVRAQSDFTLSDLLVIAEALGVSPSAFMPPAFLAAEVA